MDLCVFLTCINFIDSMSLCGLLVTLLALSGCGMFSTGAVYLCVVLRLCLKSVCLVLMNFLFLPDTPPLGVFTLYDLELSIKVIFLGVHFLTFGVNWMDTIYPVFSLVRFLALLFVVFCLLMLLRLHHFPVLLGVALLLQPEW